MKTKAPVGLEPGDVFETVWGDVKIIDKDGDEYQFRDMETGEEIWTDHDALIKLMQGTVHD
jgi:translation elongation factor P/translation initiation factor 5A